MKKTALFLLIILSSFFTYNVQAEESSAPAAAAPEAVASAAPAVVAAAPAMPEAPAVVVPPAAPEAPAAAPVNTAVKNTENLEFVSGEITGTDEAAKTITVKLYGETETTSNDKILTIKLDETTDITDGEKDRDIKSLTNGTEVDVEYDPTANKATYIFVY